MLDWIKGFFAKKADPRDAEVQAFQNYIQELEEIKERLLTRAIGAEEDLRLSKLTLLHKEAEISRLEGEVRDEAEKVKDALEDSKVYVMFANKAKAEEAEYREKAAKCDSQALKVKLYAKADAVAKLRQLLLETPR